MRFVCLTDKFFTNPKFSLINVPALNYLLRSEIFVNDDGQLRAVHLILDFEPISRSFLDVDSSIRAGDHRLGMKDDYLILSGPWSDGLACPTKAGKLGGAT